MFYSVFWSSFALWVISAVCPQKHFVSRSKQSIEKRFVRSVSPLQAWRIRMRYSALVLSFLRHSQSSHLEHWRAVCNSSVFRGFSLHFPECSDLQTIEALEMSWFFSKLFLLTPLTWNRIYTCIGPYCVVLTLDSLSYIWTCLFAEVEMQRQKGEVRREKKEPCQYKVVQSSLSSAVGCKKPYNHQ